MRRPSAELEVAERLAWRAAALVLRRFGQALSVDYKAGDRRDPVTDADRDANALIVRGVAEAFPDDAILAEETAEGDAERARRGSRRRLWCIDPIDGTREFVAGRGDFAVMIGLAEDGRARLGVVLKPTSGELVAGADGELAVKSGPEESWRPLARPAARPRAEAVVAVSRSHPPRRLLAALAGLGIERTLPMGSIGLKMAAVAEGRADVYASLSTTMCEWDTCAPEAVCRAAGARVSDLAGGDLVYNKPRPDTPGGVVACAGDHHEEVLSALGPLAARLGVPTARFR